MLVTYLGHAAIMLEAGGSRILMDPWLTDPSYDGTWRHFPPLALGVRDLPRIDYLFVSHERPDHFEGLSVWNRIVLSFRVRLARRPDRYMREFWTWFCKL